jgi:hypothetical protein
MRLRTVGIMAFWAGLFLFAWGVLAFLAAAASVSGGASGAHPIIDFAFEHFLSAGPLLALAGLVMWLIERERMRLKRELQRHVHDEKGT